jgi:Na+/H+ antiporter NhaD/arsenite permease-like protein
LLALGAALASVMGTTGASMLLIRPLLTANELRPHRAHTVIFFILLVGNVGGALSPLGDPPLFIGFLKGVEFFWTTRTLAMPTLFLAVAILAIFFAVDTWYYRKERHLTRDHGRHAPLALEGVPNFLLLAGVIGVVLMSGLWKPGVTITVLGSPVELQNLARDVLLVLLALVSLKITPATVREHNQFHWAPIAEVAKIFAAIFLTIFPVLAILEAGRAGALAAVIDLVGDGAGNPDNVMVFWTTGVLSAALDNAPTYLVFFNLAGGDAERLMGPLALTLAAISMGAVYFGALTYIGNAPNFMIKAIAEDRGVPMPSFFAYLFYAALVMLPLLVIVSAVWL